MSFTFIKKALLIESSSVRNCGDLPGARKDMENWKKHLNEGHGGGWTDIQTCSAPSLSKLRFLIGEINKTAHFGLVVFSGHGYHDATKHCDRIVLNDNEQSVSVDDFRLNGRSITLVDACRGVVVDAVALSALNDSVHNKQGMFSGRTAFPNSQIPVAVPPSLEQYRAHFDAEAAKITGRALLFSCAKGESAGENKDAGGYYTSAILRAAHKWHATVESGVHTVSEANKAAIELMRQRNYQQNPDAKFEVLGDRLPFAVKPAPTYRGPYVIHG
jgi:hypothetical protein